MAEQSRSRSSQRGGERPSGPRKRWPSRTPKVCNFCKEKTEFIDYKDANNLRQYVTEAGRIRPRRQTGVCAPHQRELSVAVKRARYLAMLSFVSKPRR
ncbi:MAG: 30S ribosomal protein S18 [Anaerolineae bacterium]|nr:30S ribosomal protein S18 [Anaerolineae bacterium]